MLNVSHGSRVVSAESWRTSLWVVLLLLAASAGCAEQESTAEADAGLRTVAQGLDNVPPEFSVILEDKDRDLTWKVVEGGTYTTPSSVVRLTGKVIDDSGVASMWSEGEAGVQQLAKIYENGAYYIEVPLSPDPHGYSTEHLRITAVDVLGNSRQFNFDIRQVGAPHLLLTEVTLSPDEVSAGATGAFVVTIESLSDVTETLAARLVVPKELSLAEERAFVSDSGSRNLPIAESDLFVGNQWVVHDTIRPYEVVTYQFAAYVAPNLKLAATGCSVDVLTIDANGLPNEGVASASLDLITDPNAVRVAEPAEVEALQTTLLTAELEATGFLGADIWGEPIDLSNAVLGLSLEAIPVEPVGVRRPVHEPFAADPFNPPLALVDRWEALATPAFVREQAAGGQVMPPPLVVN